MMPFGEFLVVSSLDLYVLIIVAVQCILWRVDLVLLDFGVLSNVINVLNIISDNYYTV